MENRDPVFAILGSMGSKKKDGMLGSISGMLNNIVGEEKGQEIFMANFGPNPHDSFMPGKILTFAELKALPEGTVIHILYKDEDGEVSEDDFHPLGKDDEMQEWNAGGSFPFPVDELKDEDLIQDIDNCGHSFTIREAKPAKQGEFRKMRQDQNKAIKLLDQLRNVHEKHRTCTDKIKKKELKQKSKDIEKQLKKLGVL